MLVVSAVGGGLQTGEDGRTRCGWCGASPDYRRYHDVEWGRPTGDDRALFEKICLEGFQAGLSWLTVLRKRENFRAAFLDFDFVALSRFTAMDVNHLLSDAGIVRHRRKIESVLNNARRACDLVAEKGSLAAYFWSFEPLPDTRPTMFDEVTVSAFARSPVSMMLSADLRARGWSFIGPTVCYSFMQATGMVNDHLDGCHVRTDVERARRLFQRPCRR